MEVFAVIKLIGACVAFIVGTIVFMVLFFRGMNWIDVWVRGRQVTDEKRRKVRRIKETKQALRLDQQQAVALGVRKSLPNKNTLSSLKVRVPDNPKTLRWSTGIDSVHVSKRPTLSHADTVIAKTEPTVETLSESEASSETTALKAEPNRSAKIVRRIVTVHLLSGETIERVAFCSKEKAIKICEGLGFEGIVLEDSDGHICVVRESNIKMVTWKAI